MTSMFTLYWLYIYIFIYWYIYIYIIAPCVRIFWVLLVLFTIGIFVFYVCDRVNEFLKFKKNISVEENYVAQMPFPSVTFCNQNRIRYCVYMYLYKYPFEYSYKYIYTNIYLYIQLKLFQSLHLQRWNDKTQW